MSDRRQRRVEAERARRHQAATAKRTLGTVGERPQSIFGPVPVAEVAIFMGIVALAVGLADGSGTAQLTGLVCCGLGVAEVTGREHFTGFRSHSTLLAAIPAVLAEAFYAYVIGVPRQRVLLLVPVVPVFGLCFWLLRRSFQSARHARVFNTRSPKGSDA